MASNLIFDNFKSLVFKADNDHEGDLVDCCKIILIISGADGEVSEQEWQVIFEFINSVGGSLKLVEELKDFDYKMAQLDDYIFRIDPDLHKILLYSSLKAARIDGLSDTERSQAIELAKLTGIDKSICTALEELLNMEDVLANLKATLLVNN